MDCMKPTELWPPTALSNFTGIASVVIGVLATAGNGMVIAAVMVDPYRKLQSFFNYFLVNIALSDLIIGIVIMPMSVKIHLDEGLRKPYNMMMIRSFHIVYFVPVTSSLLCLIVLTIEKYLAVTRPIQLRYGANKKTYGLVSCAVLAVSLSLPFVYLQIGYVNYTMVFASTGIAVGVVVMCFTYVQVYRVLREKTSTKEGGSVRTQANEQKFLAREKKVTKTICIVMLAFVGTYVPALLMILTLQYCQTCGCIFRHALRDLQFVLVCCNSFFNPIVYIIRLKNYRKAIYRVITVTFCCCSSSREDWKLNQASVATISSSYFVSESQVTSELPDASENTRHSEKIEQTINSENNFTKTVQFLESYK